MVIGVNALTLNPAVGGGVEVYLRNLLTTISEVQPDAKFVIFMGEGDYEDFNKWECVPVSPPEPEQLSEAAAAAGCDVLFSSLYCAPQHCAVPLVLFALELRTVELAKANKRLFGEDPKIKAWKQLCKSARSIVVPSEFLRKAFLELLEVPLNKCVLAPPGVSQVFSKPQASFVEEPYLLFVGTTHATKNIALLMRAFDAIAADHPHALVVVGAPGDEERDDWGPRVVRIERCSSSHLAGLYQHADLYICPSVYDGSGVTILEAMRSGARIAAVKQGGIKEVAGDVPIYFNGEDVASLVNIIRRVIQETPEDRERHAKAGQQRAADYTWENCAWKTLAAFKRQ